MKISSNIDTETQKRLTQEALIANETELFGVLLRNGVDVDAFDETTFSPSPAEHQTEAPQWQLDVKERLKSIASLKSRLEKLGG
jgi:hypothetical protein